MRAASGRVVRLGAALVLLGLLAGCAKTDTSASASKNSTSTSTTIADSKFTPITEKPAIEVVDNEFQPVYAKVKVGTTITFTNTGRNDHNVAPSVEGAFERSADLTTGQTFTLTPDKVGDLPYYCTIHGSPTAGQNGVIRVVP